MTIPITDQEWAKFRRESVQTFPPELIGGSIPDIMLSYQQELLAATSAYSLVATDKSRRIGATWGVGADAVLTSGAQRTAGGMDTLYIGYNLDMAREFIDVCGMWAKAFMPACSDVQEFLFTQKDEKGADQSIQAFRINFASGFEIVALSSRPRSLRGRQGFVILDEFAFHDDAGELLKAAMALLIWGGKILVISTHNGVDNPFNELLNDIRSGKRPGKVVHVTFDMALEQGLYQRVCLRLGRAWTPEGEAAWRAEIYKSYGSDADEELRCIPSQSSGAFLTRAMIKACMREDIPVVRYKPPLGFLDWPEELRTAEILDWCKETLRPLLAKLDPTMRSCFGQDFARNGDKSVFHPMQIRPDLSLTTPFLLEMADVPFEAQKQIVFYITKRLPRFFHGAFDATGNGAYLAEVARQEWGASIISEIKLNAPWYVLNMPKLKDAFESRSIELPLDDDVMTDYRAVVMERGVAKVPDNARSKGADGQERHGDTAIAGALAVFASEQAGDPNASVETVRQRDATQELADYLSVTESDMRDRLGGNLSDFLRM